MSLARFPSSFTHHSAWWSLSDSRVFFSPFTQSLGIHSGPILSPAICLLRVSAMHLRSMTNEHWMLLTSLSCLTFIIAIKAL